MNKIYSFIVIPFLLLIPDTNCQTKFACQPISNTTGDYALELKLEEGSADDYTFELYNLSTGDLVSKKKTFFGAGESKVIFENVEPATYSVYYSTSNCSSKKSIKGKGIVLQ